MKVLTIYNIINCVLYALQVSIATWEFDFFYQYYYISLTIDFRRFSRLFSQAFSPPGHHKLYQKTIHTFPQKYCINFNPSCKTSDYSSFSWQFTCYFFLSTKGNGKHLALYNGSFQWLIFPTNMQWLMSKIVQLPWCATQISFELCITMDVGIFYFWWYNKLKGNFPLG